MSADTMFTAPIQKLIYLKTCILYIKYHKYLDAANCWTAFHWLS